MPRPRALSSLAVILALLGLTVLKTMAVVSSDAPLTIASRLLHLDPGTAGRLRAASSLICCVTALLCAYGLWRMRPWAPLAYLAVAGSAIVWLAVFLVLTPACASMALPAAGALALLAGLYWGWRIVRKALLPLIDPQQA